ncbi:FecCD family ABC transporter permease [Caldilinea sp.]|uniref:FecCD family ABC transporter permease n=1 Tax=Caldilinea sp. TaxID=2293560 RepID=UPI002607DCCA|nr:iron ABC transporter permease [uncultured Caldilinea sp.]
MTTEPWVIVRNERPPLSLRIDRRVPPVLLGVLAATVALMVINMGVGEYPIAPLDVVKTVLRLSTDNADYHFVVNILRLPRMLVAASVGLALGVAGAIMQGITRNPLAEPGIIGISAGASLAAVTLIVVVRAAPASAVPLAAFAGAALAALLIYLLAWRKGDSPVRLVLVGIGLASVTGALTTLIMTFGDIYNVQRAMIWLTGSVYGRSWAEFWALAPWLIIFIPTAFLLARDLNALNLGEEVANGLGSQVALKRGLLLLTVVALAGASVAAAGAIGFVGLVAPHLARRLVGPLHEGVLPVSGVLGAFIVVAADLVGRTLLAPIELPCGLVTAAIGAPFFIYLLIQGYKR